MKKLQTVIDTTTNNTINMTNTTLIKSVYASKSSTYKGKCYFVDDDTRTSIWLDKNDITNTYSYKDKNNIEHLVNLSNCI